MAVTRGKRLLTTLVIGLLCMGMQLASPFVVDAFAAVDLGGYYYESDGSIVYASPDEAWNRANELGTGMGITQDWILSSRLATTAGKNVYVELNGNVIDRNLSNGVSEGEVLYVADGSTLSIYGGTKVDLAAKMDAPHSVGVWETNSSGTLSRVTKDVCGGVITGGYSTSGGGGVEMRTNATLNLCYVTVCGNYAREESSTDGYGGGVHMACDGGTLNMDHASIVYNYAQNEGGGIFVNGGTSRDDASNCRILMNHSHIDYNGAGDSGAGVAIRGSNCKLVGDAKQVDAHGDYSSEDFWYGQVFSQEFSEMSDETSCGSTIACNVIQDSDTDSGGAGVYLYNLAGMEGDSCAVSGVNIIGNRALEGGSGGGIFSNTKNVCISDCNVAYNFADKISDFFSGTVGGYGGGIDVYNDSNTIKDCTVVGNSAGQSGGGVFVYGTVDVTLGGKMIVRDNSRADDTQDNMCLGVVNGQKAHIAIDAVDGLSSDSHIDLTLDDSYFEFEAPVQEPQLMVRVTHKAEDGTSSTVEIPQEKFDDPITLTSAADTIALCTDSDDEYSQVHCKYAESNEWQLFVGPVTFDDLMNKGAWQPDPDSPTSLSTSISFRALDSKGVSDEKSVNITYAPSTYVPSAAPSFKTMSLVLSGQIGVNFFMDLPEIDGVDYTQSYMEFTVGEREAARADYDARKKSENGLYYGFTCYISSIQMAEPITAIFHYGDGQTVTCTNASVENYARSFEKNVSDNPEKYSEEAVNLVRAIVDYGHYVQLFLSEENGWEIGSDYAAMDYFFSDFYDQNEISGLVDEYDSQADLRDSGISDVTIRLSLDSSTTLEFLFTAPEGYDVYVDDDAYKLTQVSDTRWCITVPNISAHKLGDTVTVSGGTNQDGFSLSASPLAYVKIALNSSTVSDTGKTALCAFYRYYASAMSYRDLVSLSSL